MQLLSPFVTDDVWCNAKKCVCMAVALLYGLTCLVSLKKHVTWGATGNKIELFKCLALLPTHVMQKATCPIGVPTYVTPNAAIRYSELSKCLMWFLTYLRQILAMQKSIVQKFLLSLPTYKTWGRDKKRQHGNYMLRSSSKPITGKCDHTAIWIHWQGWLNVRNTRDELKCSTCLPWKGMCKVH